MLYGACAVFVNLAAFGLGYKLVVSAFFQRQYEQAKGGGHWMDFSRLADSMGLSLAVIAALFCLTCLVPFVAAWLFFLNHRADPEGA